METKTSLHYKNDRKSRENVIENRLGGLGTIVDSFIVDNGHSKGEEIHSVTEHGVIIIQNRKTNKLITELIGRPAQIKKLYQSVGRKPPRDILHRAYQNCIKGYHHT